MSDDISITSNDTAEIAREAIVSKMVTPQRGIVLPDLKSRRRKYRAADVEQAFRDIAAQVDDYQTTVTQEIVSNAQREALSLDHKMEEIRRLAAEVSNVANSTPPA